MQHAPDTLERPPLLLRESAHEALLSPVSHDFQTRVGRPGMPGPDGNTDAFVVLTRSADREMDQLSLRLAAAGIPMLRMDSDLCQDQEVCWDVEREALITPEGSFRPRACWLRYFAATAMPTNGDVRLAAYTRDQWLPWAPALLTCTGAHAVNAGAGPGAPDRIAQLTRARSVGLTTPATVVTTSLAAAARRIPGDGDLLVKALGEHFVEPAAGQLTGLAPQRIGRREATAQDAPEPAPVIVQELVPCTRELRIYAIGGKLFAFAVTRPSPEALWTEPESLEAELVPTPDELTRPLQALIATWGLDVAAFDFLDAEHGPVFLEVNAACDWLWCESLAGVTDVSAAVLELVSRLFNARRTTPTRRNER